MTLEEKVSFVTGNDFWTTKAIDRLGIPSIFMTDGPHGLRKATDGMIGGTVPATCFPTASAIASSWNKDLLYEVGHAIGREAQANDVHVVLGPGVNMKRSPLGGRNFEYFSEDPYLSGTLAASYIEGVQSTGVGTSLKHYAGNEQETERMTSDSVIDERALHETYLRAFEIAVAARPWSVMAAYNKLNGTHAAENHTLLTTILRDQWGYDGVVLSDWGAVYDIIRSIENGLQLEMPGNTETPKKLLEALNNGWLDEETLDHTVYALLEAVLHVHAARPSDTTYDEVAHHELARKAAGESIVLLKNDGAILPLPPEKSYRIAVIGEFAKSPRYQGGGSSQVNPSNLQNAFDEFTRTYAKSTLHFARGYRPDGTTTDKLVNDALKTATEADVIFVFAGLPATEETEGLDRTSIDLPEGHNRLITALAEKHKKIIVILMNGSAVRMPWANEVQGIIEAWLTGQAGGQAVVDIISGAINPSGKLSETFPARIEDTPPSPDFPVRGGIAHYREGILAGYRYYDAKHIEPQFPFGFGLSYTSFEYTSLTTTRSEIDDTDTLQATVTIKNTGSRAGAEVVQLYVSNLTRQAFHAPKDLRRFAKITLEPGEQRDLTFTLTPRDFAYYDPRLHDWRVDPGQFIILAGSSSRDLPLYTQITMRVSYDHLPPLTRDSLLREFAHHPRGKTFYRLIHTQIAKSFTGASPSGEDATAFIQKTIDDMPLSKIGMLSNGLVSDDLIDAIIIYCRHPRSLNPLHAFPLLKETGKLLARQLLRKKS